jgi:hypothetical protein
MKSAPPGAERSQNKGEKTMNEELVTVMSGLANAFELAAEALESNERESKAKADKARREGLLREAAEVLAGAQQLNCSYQ